MNPHARAPAPSLPVRVNLEAGTRIRVKQKVTVGLQSWALEVSGVVRDVRRMDTGIHTDRVREEDFNVESVLIEKPDGELTRLTIDENTQVEVLPS